MTKPCNDGGLSRFHPKDIPSTGEQRRIQTSAARVTLVEGNAGAGKTTTIALRIGEALANHVPPEKIQVLMFTDTAARVIRTRLTTAGIHLQAAQAVKVATFEQFSRNILRRVDERSVTYIDDDRGLREHVMHAMQAAHARYADRHPDIDFNYTPLEVATFIDTLRTLKATRVLDDAFSDSCDDGEDFLATVYTRHRATPAHFLTALAYERIRKPNGYDAIFRDKYDATYDLAQMLLSGALDASALGEFRLLACDEQHDCNEVAYCIIRHLMQAQGCKFIGVGDKDQVIHAHLGAHETFMGKRFHNDFPDVDVRQLTLTFRHGPHLAYPIGNFKDKDVESFSSRDARVEFAFYNGNGIDCANQVLEAVTAWRSAQDSEGNCAILLRDWHQSLLIERVLKQADIPYHAPPGKGFLQREEVRFIRGVLAFALGTFPEIEKDEREAVIDAMWTFGRLRSDRARFEAAKPELKSHPELYTSFYDAYLYGRDTEVPLTRVGALIAAWKSAVPPPSAQDVIRDIRLNVDFDALAKRVYVHPHDASLVDKTLDAFTAIVPGAGQPPYALWAWMQASRQFSWQGNPQEKVIVDIAANAKGREFGHVILPFMAKDEFPSALCKPGDEANLFYVAATRAKTRLTLITPAEPGVQSVYISHMACEDTRLRANVALERNRHLPRALSLQRDYLRKPGYDDRAELTRLGAKYDGARKAWYIEPGTDPERFRRWR